ncbi:MAG: orotidine-5'-phosphate decarboxylase, partial [Candidatus Omnitrophica bacterium]|nr:orotidine-5'-phosphate decarboxylase [Candidatus Omnitrophota bacterium]
TAEGPKIIDLIHKKEKKVFLDLKFHDIPHTVAETARVATALGVFMFNVHSAGGFEMMRAATTAAKKEAERLKIKKPLILGVTLLTSFNQQMLTETGVTKKIEEYVLQLAQQAKEAALDGIVASPQELKFLREKLGKDFIMVSPGIRLQVTRYPLSATRFREDDQKRISTPAEAIKDGADYIVVGRPIINTKSPIEAAKKIIKEMKE